MFLVTTDTKIAPPELIAWLDQELEKANLSDSEASRRAGLSHVAIYDIRSGLRPGVKKCRALSRLFGYPEEYVLRLAGHLPPILHPADLSPEAQADLDQIRRYVAMLSPQAQEQLTEQLVGIAKTVLDLTRGNQDAA